MKTAYQFLQQFRQTCESMAANMMDRVARLGEDMDYLRSDFGGPDSPSIAWLWDSDYHGDLGPDTD